MIGTAVEIIIRYSILSSKTDSLRTISMFNVIQKKTVCTYAHIKKYLHTYSGIRNCSTKETF